MIGQGLLLLGVLGLATGFAWLLMFRVRAYLERRHVLDIPNERSSHSRPTPRGGGLAIVAITLAGWVFLVPLVARASVRGAAVYAVGGLFIALVSWLDDRRSVKYIYRLAIHIALACMVVNSLGYWQMVQLPLLGHVSLGVLGLPITLVWLVGLVNAYNFMDGIDGLAGGQAVVAGLTWGLLGWLTGQTGVALLGVLLAGSSLGFLTHNWPPARVFMGDVGSAFLGFSFAALPLLFAAGTPASGEQVARAPLCGAVMVWPFVFDATFTFVRRCVKGERVFDAHRSHLYQRLVILGLSHQSVTLLYMVHSVVGASLAVSWLLALGSPDIMVLAGLPILSAALCGCVPLGRRWRLLSRGAQD
ncbi:MAG TPA: glycosyltransferase family 4 protein [Armatimonadota bacterium]|jgi:UDP-N-acetylmuramyl pentapeptide phosphotransferase/UDP-N-acetylglucosamine-1-phosphate transferase